MILSDEDVSNDGASVDEATNELLKKWTDADSKLSDADDGANPPPRSETERDNRDEDNSNESDDDDLILEDDDEDGEGDDGAAAPEAPENAVVKVKIDGEERTIAVKDLARLAGQEASLTRKSQEVAETRKAIDAENTRLQTAYGRLMEKAQERFKPYADIDWGVAAKALDTEEYAQLRQEARTALTDVQFLSQEVNGIVQQQRQQQDTQLEQDAHKAIEVLTGDGGIPNFNEETYMSMANYAVTQGLSMEQYAQVVDPVALKVLHKAMKYDQALSRAKTKRTANPTSKRILKSSTRSPKGSVGDKASDALDKLGNSGSRDDAAALLMARWKDAGDN